MADLVVGLSKTAVQFLADNVKSAIKEEAEQWKIVQRDLVFITGEFEMMQSFLDTASEEQVKNRIVRTWVRQVRDLSNDVEDNIDFVLHLDMKKRSWWLRLLPSFGRTAAELPVDEAVAQTTLLRARVVDVSQRNIRYNLIVDSASKPMPASMDPVQKTATSSFDVLINAVKKSGPLDLAGLVAKEDYRDLHVVSVCGAEGDLVNVAIVSNMYGDARVHKEFHCRAWVKLVHPFNPHEFIRSLMTQFVTHSCQEQHGIAGLNALLRMQATQSDVDLINEFAQKVNTYRYLIVLEELTSMVQWNAIRSYLPDTKNGSRIVVLTHHPVVAGQCTGEPCRVSEVWQFSPGHSARVYYKEAYQQGRVHSFVKAEPHHSLFKYGLIGRDMEMDELFEKAQQNRLISVWGMPGVGKSALVEAIYRKLLKTSDDFEMHAWVNVSHPFNPTDFCRSLLADLHSESTSSEGKFAKVLGAKDPIKECQDDLRGCVGLFVVDGVQSNEDWDCIKSNFIQYVDSRSCIIITSSEESVAKHCAAASINGIYNVKGLQATATTALFLQAFKECESYELIWAEESQAVPAAEVAAEQILPKCGGIPRVIIASARHMASKPNDVFGQEMFRLRDNIMQEVVNNPEFDSLRGLLAWMHSYLDACPRHLKKCMLYLSIFPQDIIIHRRRLIRRWIAEGYSKGTDGISMEKHAEKIFNEVAALSIMQPVLEAGKAVGYQVNGFFREYIMSRSVEETIFFPVEVSVLEMQGQGRLTTEGIGQHLAIGNSWEIDEVLFESLDFSRLRSLTLFDKFFWSFYVSDRMRVLRVLDLEDANEVNDSDFQQIGKLPSRLKFLSLRGQKDISKLPESVADLVQLQTLDIRDTSILTLPPFITRLRKLQCIRAGNTTVAWTDDDLGSSDEEEESTPPVSRPCNLTSCLPKCLRCGPAAGSRSRSSGGVDLPRGIGRLKALQTLGAVHADSAIGDGVILHQITQDLPQLKKLHLCGISRKHSPTSLLNGLYNLESLTLHFVKKNHFVQWDDLYFRAHNLRSLRMYGHLEQLTPHINFVQKLAKLTLEMTTLFTAEVIAILGWIPNLETLRLRVKKDQDGELRFPNDLFRRLQVLEIASNSTIHVTFDEGAMEKLEQLKLHCLIGSAGTQVLGLQGLVSLKQVWLLSSNDVDGALMEALQRQLDVHPKKPVLQSQTKKRRNLF